MDVRKRIALVAHDDCKKDMVEWVEWNWNLLLDHQLICTGTTGRLVEEALARQVDDEHPMRHPLLKLKSGPFGGDQQLGSMIADGGVDVLIFFWTRCSPSPTTWTSRRCFALRSCTTSRQPATGPPRIS